MYNLKGKVAVFWLREIELGFGIVKEEHSERWMSIAFNAVNID